MKSSLVEASRHRALSASMCWLVDDEHRVRKVAWIGVGRDESKRVENEEFRSLQLACGSAPPHYLTIWPDIGWGGY